MLDTASHTTVLLNEAIDALMGDPGGHYVDTTFGRGGHSRLLLSRLTADARLTVFDKDPAAIESAMALNDPRVDIRHEGFAALSTWTKPPVDGVLMDLGVSSPQINTPERGFSFRHDGPLDMRMDPTRGQSVADWLQEAPPEQLIEVIRSYGEERFASQIAKAIDTRRQSGSPIRTTLELAKIVAGAVKTREPGKDPATRTFQALRIFINGELDELQQALTASLEVLKPGGNLVVISFHSLEDRMVKQFIAAQARETVDRKALFAQPKPLALASLGRTKPNDQEIAANPRSRSAVMRVARRMPPSLSPKGQP